MNLNHAFYLTVVVRAIICDVRKYYNTLWLMHSVHRKDVTTSIVVIHPVCIIHILGNMCDCFVEKNVQHKLLFFVGVNSFTHCVDAGVVRRRVVVEGYLITRRRVCENFQSNR